MTFAEAVRKVRTAHGLTQNEMAEGFGLAGGRTICDWEAGRKDGVMTVWQAMWSGPGRFARIAREIRELST